VAASVATAEIAAVTAVEIAANAAPVSSVKKPLLLLRRVHNVEHWYQARRRPRRPGPPPLLPAPQDLPVLGRQRAEDRLQGREAAVALHFRARQDRAVA